jgi:hypothetical protein
MQEITSKWLIKHLPGYCFGSDMNLYRLPFVSLNRAYALRKIKLQNKNRYRIKKKWLSMQQIKERIYLNPKIEVIKSNNL